MHTTNVTRKLLFVCALVALTLLCPSIGRAQNQNEMNRQAEEGFVAADARLNKVYQQLTNKLDAEAVEKLKVAQRAWVAFRDAQAALQADLEARGGSMTLMIYSGTQAALTKARTKDLETLLKDKG